MPFLPELLLKLKFIESSHFQFIKFLRGNTVEYGDATKGLPLQTESVDVVYCSHMLEHLDRSEVNRFIKEAFRLLRCGGIIRIAVPDLKKIIEQYNEFVDVDALVEATHLRISRPRTLPQRLRPLLVGIRHHQWMYDGKSPKRLLQNHGFINVEIMPAGQTKISDYGLLGLHERESNSVYIEAEKYIKNKTFSTAKK